MLHKYVPIYLCNFYMDTYKKKWYTFSIIEKVCFTDLEWGSNSGINASPEEGD